MSYCSGVEQAPPHRHVPVPAQFYFGCTTRPAHRIPERKAFGSEPTDLEFTVPPQTAVVGVEVWDAPTGGTIWGYMAIPDPWVVTGPIIFNRILMQNFLSMYQQ